MKHESDEELNLLMSHEGTCHMTSAVHSRPFFLHLLPMAAAKLTTEWKAAILQSLKKNRSLAYARYFQVATIRPDGRPSNRTVVFRGFVEDTDLLAFITDSRWAKSVVGRDGVATRLDGGTAAPGGKGWGCPCTLKPCLQAPSMPPCPPHIYTQVDQD